MSDRDYSKIGQANLSPLHDNNLDVDELHMRETLGLSGRTRPQTRSQPSTAPKQRHRFVQDGEVVVTHLSGTRDNEAPSTSRTRIATLESQLEIEQAARGKAEHALQVSMLQIHALETKLAHVEIATREMLSGEREARERAEAELETAMAARDRAQLRADELAALRAVPPVAEPSPFDERPKPQPRAAKLKVAAVPRSKAPRVKEPKPVKWWLGKSPAKAASRT